MNKKRQLMKILLLLFMLTHTKRVLVQYNFVKAFQLLTN